MTRPQIVVNVGAAMQRRGAPTDTGVAFMVYAGATGSTTPVECQTAAQIAATSAPDPIQGYIARALAQGAPKVIALRADAAVPATVTEAEWTTALAKLSEEYGPGQVLIPGVSTSAAHAALLAHSNTSGRCVLLDTDKTDDAADIETAATALQAADGADRATLLAGWLTFPAGAGVSVDVPPSVVAAGLVGRGDAITGHANHAPAGDQGRGAGFAAGATDVVPRFTDAEHDDLHDAGVSVFRVIVGQPQLYGWVALSREPAYRQLNHGRTAMQLTTGLEVGARRFLFRNIDGQGLLYSELEGMLRGYLADMYAKGALYGATADDAYDVDVAGVNSAETAAAGELHSAIGVALATHTEKVVINVITRTAAQEGAV